MNWMFIPIDDQFISDVDETLDEFNPEDLPHLVLDIWEDLKFGTLWEIRLDSSKPSDYIPEESGFIFHRYKDCLKYNNPKNQVLGYFIICMERYRKIKEAGNEL